SVAGRAGLKSGDVIQAVHGRRVKNGAALRRAIGTLPPGKTVRLQVVRDQQARTIEVPDSPADR
ncbi:MAG: PDZ domain-containing protein, partial [Planctomycetales bacterium]|nr:PDZ domain-containing protein [Planctomycetales bacterium]